MIPPDGDVSEGAKAGVEVSLRVERKEWELLKRSAQPPSRKRDIIYHLLSLIDI